MKNLKNIKFEYEYRDAAGYRNGGEVIFVNQDKDINIEKITDEIRQNLFDQEFFYPYKLSVPLIHFDEHNPELDHDWYFFEGIEPTNENATDNRTFNEFLNDLKMFAKVPSFK